MSAAGGCHMDIIHLIDIVGINLISHDISITDHCKFCGSRRVGDSWWEGPISGQIGREL
jgi:hypothetical protein